ncbi:MAG: carboxypeptidase-like regulatory domain-containing protein [Planctomycetaceae bacterium]|jgi:hypothetical protein|nr:carboxypeptidase-like regulatory domain-containing protein [Planctomycetaceae bacterium]
MKVEMKKKFELSNSLLAVLVFSCFAIGMLSGCGSEISAKYAELKLAAVTGKVTLDNKPLANAQIQFVQSDGFFSYGVTDADGNYRMQFDTHHQGVKPGQCTVCVWTTMTGAGFDKLMPDGVTMPEKEIVPVQYNHQSTLTANVNPTESQTFDFDLKSSGETRNAINAEGDTNYENDVP